MAWNTCEQDRRTVGRDEEFFRYSPWSVSGMIQIGQSVTLLWTAWEWKKRALNLISASIFSIPFSIHFLWYWHGEFLNTWKTSQVGDHFRYCHDLNEWFSSITETRNEMQVTLRVWRLNRERLTSNNNKGQKWHPLRSIEHERDWTLLLIEHTWSWTWSQSVSVDVSSLFSFNCLGN